MVRLVYIPSFGTDSTLYSAIKSTALAKSNSLFTEWLPVGSAQNLEVYAQEFIDHYKIIPSDIIVGVSLGGVLAIEINKILNVKKVITISSIKTSSEHPMLFKVLRKTRAYHLFSPPVLKFGLDLIVPFYGKKVSSYMWFRKVFKNSDNRFLKWAFYQILHWENEDIPENLIHIHGSRDPLFPAKNAIQIDHLIAHGTHAMIRFKADIIAQIIKKEIS